MFGAYNNNPYQAAQANQAAQVGKTSGGLAYDPHNSDSFINAVNQQALWDREDLLRREGNEWDAHQLDRFVEAARRNGINPVLLLNAMDSGTSASYTTSAAKTNNYDSNARTDAANSAKVVGAIIGALAMIAASL